MLLITAVVPRGPVKDLAATMRAPNPGSPVVSHKVLIASAAQASDRLGGAGISNVGGRKGVKASAVCLTLYRLNPKEPVLGRAGTAYTCTSIQDGH